MMVRLLSNPHVTAPRAAPRTQGNVGRLPVFHQAEGVQSNEPAGVVPV
jgi:hypothetical protein